MTVLTSRIILGLETLIIVTPLSLLFGYGLPVMFHDAFYSPTADAWALATAGMIILATLCCAWVLIWRFLIRGIGALRSLSFYWWVLPVISGGLSSVVTLHLIFADVVESSAINTFGWGIPFLIPLVHLFLERWLRPDSNLSSGIDWGNSSVSEDSRKS
jgi:hypothetical protein